MQINHFTDMIQALSYLEREGFSHTLMAREEGLYCPELRQHFQPEPLSIVGYQRLEGNKDLGDVAVIYAISGEPDLRGVIVDGYGTYADTLPAEYIQRLPIAVARQWAGRVKYAAQNQVVYPLEGKYPNSHLCQRKYHQAQPLPDLVVNPVSLLQSRARIRTVTPMEINTCIEKGHYLIWLRGELDASSSLLLDDSIRDGLDKNPLSIRVDCAELRYISSAGLGVFVSHLHELQDKAIPLVLFALRQPVENVFQVLGLDRLIPILPDGNLAGLYCESKLGSLSAHAGTA